MTTAKKNPDVEAIVAEAEPLTLSNGFGIKVKRIRTRETFKLLKIITGGFQGSIGSLLFGENDSEEAFTGALLGAVIVSIPDAEDEAIDFIQAMVEPSNIVEDPRTKPEREANEEAYAKLGRLMENPELDDLVTIIEKIITNEGPQIRALGNRLALLLKVQASSAAAKQGGSSRNASKN